MKTRTYTYCRFALASICSLLYAAAMAQAPMPTEGKKSLTASRIEADIKLDGLLNEAVWQSAAVASDFVLKQPRPGEQPAQRTEVRVLYDNTGLYVGAMLYDTRPDSIMQEISQRDVLGNTDWFGVVIDAFRDGINGLGFIVTPADLQMDVKFSIFDDDPAWDAVWDNKAVKTPEGWSVEIRIPYAALRFPAEEIQYWHINFGRFVARNREESFWNEINPLQAGTLNQSGYLMGIQNIRPPVRLQATPYVAAYATHHREPSGIPKNAYGSNITGGMDVKMGLSDAFTLDMTLIPDFGEAQTDNQVLNLSPFEVRFNENRAFFTEGTELFNKGNLFYSRRIGGNTLYGGEVAAQLGEGESLLSNPRSAQLYNATKISGRTAKGTGLGFFNATSGRAYARIQTESGEERRVLTDPFTNFNVLVVDQNLPHNSYATLINTTVLREGDAYDANVTGIDFNLRDKANNYALKGFVALSQLYEPGQANLGHTASISARKTSGNWQGAVSYLEESHTYDPNDLGFLYNNNSRVASSYVEYNNYTPTPLLNARGAGAYANYNRLYHPSRFTDWKFENWVWAETRSFWRVNVWTEIQPSASFDFFEPREPGRYWRNPGNFATGGSLNTDSRKRLQLSLRANHSIRREPARTHTSVALEPRFRLNDRFNFSLSTSYFYGNNDVGYVNKIDTEVPDPATGEPSLRRDVIFGTRALHIIETGIRANYAFNANMVLNFRLRHYWTTLDYRQYYRLLLDGRLENSTYSGNHNRDFDAFNIDLIYRWRFAPGSDLIVVWKNNIFSFSEVLAPSYLGNLNRLFNGEPQDNNLSVKLIYFLDYASLVKS